MFIVTMVRCSRVSCENFGLKCGTCTNREWRKLNPISYSYINLRDNAKRRFISFEISPLQWWVFCLATNYHIERGVGPDDLSVDRIDVTRGYSFDNIQVLTMAANTKKKMKVDALRKLRVNTGKQPGDPF